MQFGLYAPVPHVSVGSPEIASSIAGAMGPLPDHEIDPQITLAKRIILAADAAGFDLVLFAERHRGPDFEAFILAAAVSSWTKRIKTLTAVHPGLWHPTLIAKMAATIDRLTPGRSAINLVTGWNEAEARMFGGDVLLNNDDRYVRAEEFVHVLRGMWRETPFSYEGRFYDVSASELLLKPAADIDIFTASRSTRGLDMVASVGDWWFVELDSEAQTPEHVVASLRRTVADMNQRAARVGRKVRYAFNPYIAFGASAAAALAEAEGLLAAAASDADRSMMKSYIGPAMRAGCIGPPEAVRRQLQIYAEIGIELFLFKFVPNVDNIRAIEQEVILPLRAA
jgi:FMNH2-dependent dimethyl sulfone monooxygenase